jgi:hypothetical protein
VFEIDTKNHNAVLRQIPQMVAPPLTVGGPTPPRPDLNKQVTAPVNPPAARPASPSIKPK